MEEVTKVTMGSSNSEPEVYKVDLDNPTTNETEETTADTAGVVGSDENVEPAQEQEAIQPEGEVQEEEPSVLEEVTDEPVAEQVEKVEEVIEEAVAEAEATGKPLPENIQKLVDFMDETGGSLEDYVRLNTDISKLCLLYTSPSPRD